MKGDKKVPTVIGLASEAQIAEWKAASKYGIYGAMNMAKTHIAYFRVPDLNDLNCSYAKQDVTRPFDKWAELANVTYLGGSEEMLTNDRFFASIVNVIQEQAEGEQGSLVNL